MPYISRVEPPLDKPCAWDQTRCVCAGTPLNFALKISPLTQDGKSPSVHFLKTLIKAGRSINLP
jgi:hypothetical protein